MVSFAPQPFESGATVPQLKVLVAGVSREERRPIEATVKQAFADRDPTEAWSVSLVRLGSTWSIVLNGPTERFSNVSLSAEDHRLAEAIREAIREPANGNGSRTASPAPSVGSGGAAALSTPEPAPTAGRALVQDHHVCGSCQKGILVSYDSEPDEPRKLAAVACPHCWEVSRVPIGAWAVEGGDYRAERE